jgi:hypothetical protein
MANDGGVAGVSATFTEMYWRQGQTVLVLRSHFMGPQKSVVRSIQIMIYLFPLLHVESGKKNSPRASQNSH